MTNIEALSRLCTAIANTFYPDSEVLKLALFNDGVDAEAAAQPKDPKIFRCAVRLVRGYVEASRSEGSVSTSVMQDAVEKSLNYWCNYYGLDADEELSEDKRTISDATNLW
ncbi:DUF6706 family protein [Bacteroides xylanisolvens]|uniref:DUF6706 family protein n=1 Tax=Bacteroides xylanisolvens TaxID=371601 RepID=UPI001CDC7B2C|nr:DUF6706 family protein [Bacteroides xylanisolvens]MCA4468115.1 hypothetical protein [Bacteroides xylanisolvens]MCA4472557.1 hypothetical protein [Bacteroides xylanisolvens]MCA4481707.1 hypothetical protein [Bacteroides xylanisolvens]MCA4521532.1 hypothetical protein [Bacteroides xylanisolvens]MCA4558096.1 hypothetical protein [Bacteroides xylanisolvens]